MDRYSRQILYKNIRSEGQLKISSSTIIIVGVGALGSVSSEMFARAGVKKLILIDRDYVEESNLQRQTLFSETDAIEKMPKVIAAQRNLLSINSHLQIDTYIEDCDYPLLKDITNNEDIDLIIDGTDNFETRLLLNDVAYLNHIPFISASCVEDTYTAISFIPEKTACYRCLIPTLPTVTLTCDTAGIISPAVHMAVSHQVTLALQILVGDVTHSGYLRMGNVWDGTSLNINTAKTKNVHCPTCGDHPNYPATDVNPSQFAYLCGRDTMQIKEGKYQFEAVKTHLNHIKLAYKETPYFIELNYKTVRIVVFKNGRILLHGVNRVNEAKTIIHQLLG